MKRKIVFILTLGMLVTPLSVSAAGENRELQQKDFAYLSTIGQKDAAVGSLTAKNNPSENKLPEHIKTVEAYDAELVKRAPQENVEKHEMEILRRDFVQKIGYDVIVKYYNSDQNYRDTINWITTDQEALRYYITGGTLDKGGSYENSLKVLNNLYTAHKEDLKNEQRDAETGVVFGDLYKRTMISLSLTHASVVNFWADEKTTSDAVKRYELFKELRNNHFIDKYKFDNLPVEDMRWVMNNRIDEAQMKWLNNYVRTCGKKNPLGAYSHITYTSKYRYDKPEYYDQAQYEKWNKKYNLKEFNIPYETGHPKLWIVFEEGAVCGGISKTGSNLHTSFGIPSVVIGQPGHAAFLKYSVNEQGKGMWHLDNDVSGWKQSEKGERLLNGWGSSAEKWESKYQVSYVQLAQAALNDIHNYEKATEYVLLANSYSDTALEKKQEIYKKALEVQPIHLQAVVGLIKAYQADATKTEADYIDLTKQITKDFGFYALPMWDTLRLIEPKITTPSNKLVFDTLRKTALERASKATEQDTLQPDITKAMAGHLLKENDLSLASFSFDGPKANKIVLADRFGQSGTRMKYSLDGGTTWTESSEKEVELTADQLSKITAEKDIRVNLVGAQDENVCVIDIQEGGDVSNLYNNDLENKVAGAGEGHEWSVDQKTWKNFGKEAPDLTGNKTVYVRTGAKGTKLAGKPSAFVFKEDVVNEKEKYISLNHISIEKVSSEQPNRQNGVANLIDGNLKSIWHTSWNGGDKERYVILKIDKVMNLSAIEYVPRQDAENGRILNAKIFTSTDGKKWDEIVKETKWENNSSTKKIAFEKPVSAQYVKIVGVNTVGNHASGAMVNMYEDATKNN